MLTGVSLGRCFSFGLFIDGRYFPFLFLFYERYDQDDFYVIFLSRRMCQDTRVMRILFFSACEVS